MSDFISVYATKVNHRELVYVDNTRRAKLKLKQVPIPLAKYIVKAFCLQIPEQFKIVEKID